MRKNAGFRLLAALAALVPAAAVWAAEATPAAPLEVDPAAVAAPSTGKSPAVQAVQPPQPAAAEPSETSPQEMKRLVLLAQLSPRKQAWYPKIRQLACGPMASASTKTYREGEKKLLDITDPDALEPMALALYGRNTRWRSSFVKAAHQYAQGKDDVASKVAVTYLSDVATRDQSGILRGKARAALLHRDTPRHPQRLRYQLVSNPDGLVRDRAAGLLADLKDTRMLDAMVELLMTEEWRLVGKEIESRSVQMDVRATNAGPPTFVPSQVTAAVPYGIATATIDLPIVQVTQIQTTISAPAGVRIDYDWEKVTVRHPGVLDALRRLTDRNFGYDKDAWCRWLASQERAKEDRKASEN